MTDHHISNFADITGANPRVARGYLDLAGGDLEQAVQLFFENPDLASSFETAAPPPVPAHTRPSASTATGGSRANIGREDDRGVIHLDSDDEDAHMTVDEDDDEIEIPDDDDDEFGDARAAQEAARAAQEDEDAAMARRLQEELYAGNTAGDGIRSPIARTTETLVAPHPAWGGDDEVEAAIMEQMARRRQATQHRPANPFAQSIWDDPDRNAPPAAPATSSSVPTPYENGSRAQRLAELFRPPFDLLTVAPWDAVRAMGKEDKKWIMVNLQDMSDFQCQALNRDIWKDPGVRDLVSEHFFFLQFAKEDASAREYITFYFPHQSHENPDIYPHVSIVDPRTGEQVKVWSGKPFPTAADFRAQVTEFLDRYSLAANSKNPVAKTSAPRPKVIDVDRMTEEEMLEMALQNSLETGGGGGESGESSSANAKTNVVDPDSLTKSPLLPSENVRRKGKESAYGGEISSDEDEDKGEGAPATASTPAPTANVFASISSSNPHVEPANDPKTTTRIQFRHPTGRVIRRFGLNEHVERLYEWLKAEPMEGKAGVQFELKTMPAGRDLLEDLDKTIEAAGLKQGTVMVEFIED